MLLAVPSGFKVSMQIRVTKALPSHASGVRYFS